MHRALPYLQFLIANFSFLRQHRTIPALRLKHRFGGCRTSLAVSALRIMRYCHNKKAVVQFGLHNGL